MRNFAAYCFYKKELWAYDWVTHALFKMVNDRWKLAKNLSFPEERMYSAKISVLGDHICVWTYGSRDVFRYDTAADCEERIRFEKMEPDNFLGICIGNLVLTDSDIIALPLKGKKIERYSLSDGSAIEYDDLQSEIRKAGGLRQDEAGVFIRAWGAPIVDGRLYMILSGKDCDKIGVFDMKEQHLEMLPVQGFERLFHLDYHQGYLWVQAFHNDKPFMAKLSLDGAVAESAAMPDAEVKVSMQWLEDDICFVLGESKITIIDRQFEVRTFECADLEYVSDGFLSDRSGGVYHATYSDEEVHFEKVAGITRELYLSYQSEEYKARMKMFAERGLVEASPFLGLDLGSYIEFVNFCTGENENR